MENEENLKLKCSSCGAGLKIDEKECSYCKTINPNYKNEIKELKPAKGNGESFGNLFGGLFSGSLLGMEIKSIIKEFEDENK